MKKVLNSITYVLLSMSLLFVLSCSTDERNPLFQEQTVSATEVQTILDIDNHTRTIDTLVNDLFETGPSGKSSKPDDCIVTEYTATGFTATFTDCSVEGSQNVTGSLSVTYKEGEESTAFTATYTDLTVGEIVINGTRSFTLDNNLDEGIASFDIVSDMRIELADGSIIEETGTKSFVITIDLQNLENSSLTIAGDWMVKADENNYTINISTPIKINFFSCNYVAEGVMSLNKNGLGVTVDFGDGTCDAIATLTYPDGTEEDLSLKE